MCTKFLSISVEFSAHSFQIKFSPKYVKKKPGNNVIHMLLNSLSQVPALELVDFFYFIIDFIETNYLKDVFFLYNVIQCHH